MNILLLNYLGKKFPLSLNIPIIFIFNITLYGGAGINESEIIYSNNIIFGFLTIFFVFFHLRLFDDLKDYSKDKNAQILTRKQLTYLLVLTVLLEIVFASILGLIPLIFYSIVLLYSILMYFEFFIKEKLNQSILAYNLSHQFIIVLTGLYIYSFYHKTFVIDEPIFFLFLILMFSMLCLFEVIRKIKDKDDPDYKKSYEVIFGKTKLTLYFCLISIIIAISTGLIFYSKQIIASIFLQVVLLIFVIFILIMFYKSSKIVTNKIIKIILAAYLLSTLALLDLTIILTKDVVINILGWMTVI